LHLTLARTARDLGDASEAIRSLRAAVALDPEQPHVWKDLYEAYASRDDWRGAIEALVRMAHAEREPSELSALFLRIGEIYEGKLDDLERAEAAYRRALEYGPPLKTHRKLASLYERHGDHAKAASTLEALIETCEDKAEAKELSLRLARVLDAQKLYRECEELLDRVRRDWPTDLDVIRALADLYAHQGARAAHALHLNRAIADLRDAFVNDPSDERTLPTLVEVYRWQSRLDAARATASVATALGIARLDVAKVVDAAGAIPGAGKAAFDPMLDDILAPDALQPATRAVLEHASPVFEKVSKLETSWVLSSRRVPDRDPRIAAPLRRAKEWLGREVTVYETDKLGRVCFPVQSEPLEILMGRRLLDACTEDECLFLLLRAGKVSLAGLGVVTRVEMEHLATLLRSIRFAFDLDPMATASKQEATVAARISKAIGKKEREALLPLVRAASTRPDYEARRIALAACELGDRAALVATGSVPAGMGALLKMAGVSRPMTGPTNVRAAGLARVEEALGLVLFGLSEEHFEARMRTGADRKDLAR
ncbi:MAG: tetratricopeptide repeat protein, partial [Myxococcales bacterium]|nr:tetratricopeptide repeat protein [Myxococcales bacterium]